MARSGFQLTTFLYGLYAGRRKLPALPPYLSRGSASEWTLGCEPGPVTFDGSARATQVDPTTCGSASLVLAQASDPSSEVAVKLGVVGIDAKAEFDSLQADFKNATNRRKAGVAWPHKFGTPPWGASREMRFSGHNYYDRMVVDTSLPQSSRILTHAAQSVLRGFPVLLYVGGDTSMGWDAGVPRHVVVLHSPPEAEISDDLATPADHGDQVPAPESDENLQEGVQVEAQLEAKLAELEAKIQAKLNAAKDAISSEELFDPQFLIYEPSRGINTPVTLRQLIDKKVPREAFGGWPHVMWAVLPEPVPSA